jgi:SPP1 family predicted phage head-tail adaptor
MAGNTRASGAGALDKRVILQSPGGANDGFGERVAAWTNVATVSAAIDPITSNERFLAAQQRADTTHTVTIRYSSAVSGIDASWRVLYGSRVLVLNGAPINVGEENRFYELPCVEGLRQK